MKQFSLALGRVRVLNKNRSVYAPHDGTVAECVDSLSLRSHNSERIRCFSLALGTHLNGELPPRLLRHATATGSRLRHAARGLKTILLEKQRLESGKNIACAVSDPGQQAFTEPSVSQWSRFYDNRRPA